MYTLPTTPKDCFIQSRISRFLAIITLSFFAQVAFSQNKVGINTTSPLAGLHIESELGFLSTATFGSGFTQIGGPGTRMMWTPRTASFRVGRLTDEDAGLYETWWDFANTGDYSFVTGVNTRAKGYISFATGHKNSAEGNWSSIIGGQGNTTLGYGSFVTGYGNTAYSLGESVLGMWAESYSSSNINHFEGTDRIFTVGNGSGSGLRSNAITVLKNGRTGLGISVPEARLHVSGEVLADSIQANGFRLGTSATSGHVLVTNTQGIGVWTNPASLSSSYWMPSGDNIFRNSNVGIGEPNPGAPLHVIGNVMLDNSRLQFVNTGNSIFIGENAGLNDDHSINRNVLIGSSAGRGIVNGQNNIAIGENAMINGGNAGDNVAIGYGTMTDSLTGNLNTAVGTISMNANTSGSANTAVGNETLKSNTTGHNNAVLGAYALQSNQTGSSNVAIGRSALMSGTQLEGNVAIGRDAGQSTTGDQNTMIGYAAGAQNDGSHNVFLGNEAGKNAAGSNQLYIDNSSTSTPLIYGDFATNKVIINDSLTSKYMQMTNGAQEGYILKSDSDGDASWVSPAALNLNLWTLDSDKIYNTGFKPVGIGVTNPTAPLHVKGNAKIKSGRLEFEDTEFGTCVGYNAGLVDTTGNLNASTFIGYRAGESNTTGGENIAVGAFAFKQSTTGGFNVVMGNGAMGNNTSGSANTAIGYNALTSNIISGSNTAIGYYSLAESTNGTNTAVGLESGQSNVSGSGNTFIGSQAGKLSTGSNNVFLGKQAGLHETGDEKLYIANSNTATPLIYGDFSTGHLTIHDSLTASEYRVDGGRINFINSGQSVFIGDEAGQNDDLSNNHVVFIGHDAGKSNENGENNVAIGAFALDGSENVSNSIAIGKNVLGHSSLTGNNNVGVGNFSLAANEGGNENTALGQSALGASVSGDRNIAIGNYTMDANLTGDYNTAIGYEAFGESTDGEMNTGVGYFAGHYNTGIRNTFLGGSSGFINTGSSNVFIGFESGYNESGSNRLHIANSGIGDPLIYGEFDHKKVIINDSLSTKYFQLTNGATTNYVLKSDQSGRGSWSAPYALFHNNTTNNLFIGEGVGNSVTTATDNTIVGAYAGEDMTSGYENTGLGLWSLKDVTTGTFNTGIGHNTLSNVSTASKNTALGWSALAGATGASNVALGGEAGGENTTGSRNVYVGTESGTNNTGSDNVFIGYRAGKNEAGSNKLYIENTDSSTPLILGDFSTNEVTINDSVTIKGELGVGNIDPKSTLEVNGSVAAKFKTPLIAGTNNPDNTGMVWRYNSGSGTITLPAAGTCPNRMYVIINQTGTPRTISTYRDLTTTNQTSLSSSVALWLMSDGSEWWQIK